MRRHLRWTVAAAMLAAMTACMPADETPLVPPAPPVGGANSPKPSQPPELLGESASLGAKHFAVRVPIGNYKAPKGGAPAYTVPGPIIAFRGPDGQWRGHGYLETYPRLLSFEGKVDRADKPTSATLSYTFEGGKTYRATVTVDGERVLLEETSDLGPRNLFVLDCYYQWQPAAGFAVNRTGTNHAFVYLPCYYDKPEVTISPGSSGDAKTAAGDLPGAVAVVASQKDKTDVLALWCRDIPAWKGRDSMGIQLWQRRQLPGDPSSRHFLGPETKSDSTPNPRTADMLGKSLYEGHVTVELSLGVGTRMLGLTVYAKPADLQKLPQPLKSAMADDASATAKADAPAKEGAR